MVFCLLGFLLIPFFFRLYVLSSDGPYEVQSYGSFKVVVVVNKIHSKLNKLEFFHHLSHSQKIQEKV